MLAFPIAKINLGLYVVRRRPDGYHDLQTVFCPIPLADALEIIPNRPQMEWDDGGWSTTQCPPRSNLVWKAYDLLCSEVKPLSPVQIILRKRIPSGAGLGGGSSDAAFALRMLAQVYDLDLSVSDLRLLAKRLGADCPFFIAPEPSYATGIGDHLTPFPLDLSGLWLYLLLPGISVSTAYAYREITPRTAEVDLIDALGKPLSSWRENVHNHFEPVVFARYPILGSLKRALLDLGAEFALMSGSGSTLFALSTQRLDTSSLERTYLIQVLEYKL